MSRAVLAALACAAAALLLLGPREPLYLPAARVDEVVPPGARSLGLLAHYSDAPALGPNLVEYVRQLAREFEVFVLLTNHGELADAAGLPANCRVVTAPNHGGLDFGKWAFALHNLGPRPALRRVGLFNDSVFVVRDVAPFFRRAEAAGWRAWGMTGSEQIAPHLQSYFVVADGAEAARALLGFFRGRDIAHVLAPGYTKEALVGEFELGLSRHLARIQPLHAFYTMRTPGLRGGALTDNPSMAHWDALLDLGMPVLKKMRYERVPGAQVLQGLRDEPAAATLDEATLDARVRPDDE